MRLTALWWLGGPVIPAAFVNNQLKETTVEINQSEKLSENNTTKRPEATQEPSTTTDIPKIEEHRALAYRYLDALCMLTLINEISKATIDEASKAGFHAATTHLETHENALKAVTEVSINVRETKHKLIDQITDVVMENYSANDLGAILTFLESGPGKKYTESIKFIKEASHTLLHEWIEAVSAPMEPIIEKAKKVSSAELDKLLSDTLLKVLNTSATASTPGEPPPTTG